MSAGFASFLPGLGAFVLFALLSPLALQARPQLPPVALHFAVAVLTHLLGTLAGALLVPDFAYWHGGAAFALPVMGYVFAFGAVQKSVSLRMLCALHRAPGHRLSLAELTEQVVRPTFEERVALLQDQGLVGAAPEGFQATAAGKRLVAKLARLHKLAGIERAGLYGD